MQMRSRILYLQGQMIIDAKRGAGVRMAISFPLQEGISA
jgi:signal transduction histidine kinase